MVAVYDLGGGTFDVSIIELNQGVIEVHASHGDTHLGGDDFDELLVNWLAEQFKKEHGLDPKQDRKALARLVRAAEQAKITLSTQPFARVREEYLMEKGRRPLHLDAEVSRHELEEMIQDLLGGTLTAFDQALEDAGLKAKDLDKVLFVGGSTRIPLVWEMVANHVGLEPMVEVNPDEAVALGAGVQAAIIAGEPLDAILVDVTPHSIGIEVAEWFLGRPVPDRYSVIIHRNTTLPTTRAQVFWAMTPQQTQAEIKVYQGESPIASQNTLLGEFMFEGLKQEEKDKPPCVTVEFDLDVNGILKVEALDRGSKKVKQSVLRAAHTRLSPSAKEASQRHLENIWETVGEGEGEVIEAAEDPLVARARRLLARGVADMSTLADLVNRLEAAKRSGEDKKVDELSDELADLLYEMEEEER
jgi:molecular chaperone DnaK